ncbi:MAG: PD-(D/E)XK nuclease family protein [Gemmatimonadetes bacterium]|nr:PD-(D/E)XK nuclease family protein [Gemmatimonadota bacterium]
MTSPNLFNFATKELSQDAVICWLIAWAGAEAKGKAVEEELRRCGRVLLDALFRKWRDWGDVELDDYVRTEVLHQEQNIDVLARVNDRFVLLIEDKTNTAAHDDQLAKYWDLVTEGKTSLGTVDENHVYPIYFKTGNHSLRDRQHAEEQEYRAFDRSDFLSVLETYNGGNEILLDFRRHLERWEQDTHSFRQWTRDGAQWTNESKRASRGWEGFYRWVEENCLDGGRDNWGPLGSLVGGYGGVWIETIETSRNSRFAIWLEKDRISIRLYGAKRKVSVTGMNRDKKYWAQAFDGRGSGSFTRPRRLQATRTKPMCVAEWRGWLVPVRKFLTC